jgi:hypothetical protein
MEAKRAPGSGAKTESFFSSQDGATKNLRLHVYVPCLFFKKIAYQDTGQKNNPMSIQLAIDCAPINHRSPAIYLVTHC